MLQQGFAGILGVMSHPHAGSHDPHEHDHEHEHGHAHQPAGPGLAARLRHRLRPHSHEPADQVDAVMEASAEGMRVLWITLGILGATALIQAVVTALSGSVALLGDTLHNAADALTALPLGVAFVLGRRPPTRRYTYGYGRAEDLAGIAIVLTIAASSALAAYEALTRLLHPHHVSNLIAVAAAALVGFAGNELAAMYRIRTGRKIGSAALVADGLHARTDGLTSLAVLLGAGGVALGWDWADPVVGLVITVAILAVLRQAAREIYRRLMDAVDPALIDPGGERRCAPSGRARSRAGPAALDRAPDPRRMRVVVDPGITAVQAHDVAVAAEHALLHADPAADRRARRRRPPGPWDRSAPRPGQPPGRPRPRARIILTWRAHPACQTAGSMHRPWGGGDHPRSRPRRRALRCPRGPRPRRRPPRPVHDRHRRGDPHLHRPPVRRPVRVLPPRHPARPRTRLTPPGDNPCTARP